MIGLVVVLLLLEADRRRRRHHLLLLLLLLPRLRPFRLGLGLGLWCPRPCSQVFLPKTEHDAPRLGRGGGERRLGRRSRAVAGQQRKVDIAGETPAREEEGPGRGGAVASPFSTSVVLLPPPSPRWWWGREPRGRRARRRRRASRRPRPRRRRKRRERKSCCCCCSFLRFRFFLRLASPGPLRMPLRGLVVGSQRPRSAPAPGRRPRAQPRCAARPAARPRAGWRLSQQQQAQAAQHQHHQQQQQQQQQQQ